MHKESYPAEGIFDVTEEVSSWHIVHALVTLNENMEIDRQISGRIDFVGCNSKVLKWTCISFILQTKCLRFARTPDSDRHVKGDHGNP